MEAYQLCNRLSAVTSQLANGEFAFTRQLTRRSFRRQCRALAIERKHPVCSQQCVIESLISGGGQDENFYLPGIGIYQ